VALVDTWLGAGPPQPTQERIFYRGQRTQPQVIMGASEAFVDINFAKIIAGRSLTPQEVERRRHVAVIGYGPYEALFEASGVDPVGKKIRIGVVEYTIVGVIGKRPAAGGFSLGQDDFAIIPYTTFRKQFGSERAQQPGRFGGIGAMIAVVPHEWASRDEAMREVEEIMRIRHGLTLDEPNDFDLVTQDAVLQVWEQVSSAVLVLARGDLVDRADGRRHRRDGHHDHLGHRAHARDRRAQGDRRAARRRSCFSSSSKRSC
jgi:putative ABC transport system permease protein